MQSQLDAFRKSFGICCFSRKYDKTLMWSHYAKNHYGICLGFRGFFTNHETLIFNVKYVTKLEKISIWKDREKLIPMLAFRKSHEWEYEEEVRILNVNKSGLLNFDKPCLTEVYYGLKTKDCDVKDIDALITINSYDVKKYKMRINPSTYNIIRSDY